MSINPTLGVLELLQTHGVIDSLDPSTPQPAWIGSEGFKPHPDRMVATLISGGRDSHPSLNIDWPQVQVLVRGQRGEYSSTLAKAREVKSALLGLANLSIGGELWASVRLIGDISPAGVDENNRDLFSMNYELIIHTDDLGNRAEIF